MPDPQQPRQPYVFGPLALLRRIVRWHLHAPLWQVLLLTALFGGLIGIAWVTGFTIPPW